MTTGKEKLVNGAIVVAMAASTFLIHKVVDHPERPTSPKMTSTPTPSTNETSKGTIGRLPTAEDRRVKALGVAVLSEWGAAGVSSSTGEAPDPIFPAVMNTTKSVKFTTKGVDTTFTVYERPQHGLHGTIVQSFITEVDMLSSTGNKTSFKADDKDPFNITWNGYENGGPAINDALDPKDFDRLLTAAESSFTPDMIPTLGKSGLNLVESYLAG